MKRNWVSAIALSILVAIMAVTFNAINSPTSSLQARELSSLTQLSAPPANLPNPSPPLKPSPQPTASPSPTGTPAPKITPPPSIPPSPRLPVSPSLPLPPSPPRLPLADVPHTDIARGYRAGIIEGYTAVSRAGITVIASPDRNLAYTIAIRQRAVDLPLSPASLAQIAIDTFLRGEGFVAGNFEPIVGGTQIPWTGTFSNHQTTQPMSGLIFARQVPGKVLLLFVAATEEAKKQVDSVLATVAPTLEAL